MDSFFTLLEKGFAQCKEPGFKIDAEAFWGIIPFLSLLRGEVPLPPLPPALVHARCEIAKEEKALEKEKTLLGEKQVSKMRCFWKRNAMKQAMKTGEIQASSPPEKNGVARGAESFQLITREHELEQNLRLWDFTVDLLLNEQRAVPVGYTIEIRIWQESLIHALVKERPVVLNIRGDPQTSTAP